ncbi:MAG: ATP-dependent endonuclease [Desulfobacteraceae bacterium 4572_35.1]|nr:MAG: ATP-dependent endonuclease [Desulfobacteraceae bacterium 4572_35.1]
MQLCTLRLSNFQCFGPVPTTISFENISFLIGPNGSGKTAVLQALSRMFGFDPKQRRFRKSDFHIPFAENDELRKRQLWIEVEFELPELLSDELDQPTVPPQFGHMRLQDEATIPTVRIRLTATMDLDGEIQDEMIYVLSNDSDGNPVDKHTVSNLDRKSIQVYYLPARRDPADHIAYSTNALLGRLLRSANWADNLIQIKSQMEQVSENLKENIAISTFDEFLTTNWKRLHKGHFFSSPALTFSPAELEALFKYISISFIPGHDDQKVDFSRLSDGQKSLLYLSLVMTIQQIGRELLKIDGDDIGYDLEKLRPPTFTIIAIEEPENSLAPHYLGRIFSSLKKLVDGGKDAQAMIATHAPSILRRVKPEQIRYLRLNSEGQAQVTSILMPEDDEDANKFVRQAVQAFPEVYVARLVILGEGDSEEIVLPRILQAKGMPVDEQAICVAPLGGRHVNHFWRLLSGLQIPYVTLLDLDLARNHAGWGRLKVANDYLRKFHPGQELPSDWPIPKWDGEHPCLESQHYFEKLEERHVFFSSPLDLDFSMLKAYPESYKVINEDPDETLIKTVLGNSYHGKEQYTLEEQQLFKTYKRHFKNGSKPAAHLGALASLSDEEICASLPPELDRLAEKIQTILNGLPE